MKSVLKQAISTNKILKLMSLIFGITCWTLISRQQTSCCWFEVPVCFYNVPEGTTIKVEPESVLVKLKGKAADLEACSSLALHINASTLKEGQHRMSPSVQELFLPDSVKLVHHQPLSVGCTVSHT